METVIQIIAIGGPALLAVLGLFVTFRPPHSKGKGWKIFSGFFVIIAVLSTIASISETRLSNQTLRNIQEGIDKLIGKTLSRTIPIDKNNEIMESLKPFSTLGMKVTIFCSDASEDACTFAGQWKDVLKDAGWIPPIIREGYSMSHAHGVLITVKSRSNPAASALQQAFRKIGVDALGELNNNFYDDQIHIDIEIKS